MIVITQSKEKLVKIEKMAVVLKNFEDVFSIPQENDEKFFEDVGEK